jgi:hypothetical protein
MPVQWRSHDDDERGGPGPRSAALVVALVVAVLVLPWLVPAVPGFLGGLFQDPASAGVPASPDAVSRSARTPRTQAPPPAKPSLVGVRLGPAGVPDRVVVDRLSVRSGVVPISGNSGVLLPPSDPQLLGWWQEGAVPGAARGTAVFTGHTVHTGGGALDDLSSLVPGDRVRVQTSRGTIGYAVTSVRDYSTAAVAKRSRQIFRLGGPGRLVLVTCAGWNGETYLSNTVVVAQPVAARFGT